MSSRNFNLYFIFIFIFLFSITKSFSFAEEPEAQISDKQTAQGAGAEEYSKALETTGAQGEQRGKQELQGSFVEGSEEERSVEIQEEGVLTQHLPEPQLVTEQGVIETKPSAVQQLGPNRISLDIKGMDIVDVLKLLSSQGNLNIVTGKNVSGRVSMFLKDVDIWDAFEIIIAANSLAYEKKGEIINVMSARDYEVDHGEKYGDRRILITKKLQYANAKDVSNALNQIKSALGKVVLDENSNTLIILEAPEKLETMGRIIEEMDLAVKPLQTKVFELRYADSEKLKEKLQEILTRNVGILKTDERTKKIVVMDYPDKLAKIEEMIKAFDEKTRQVLIEAKIIQVTLTDTYKAGIDWKYIADKQLNFTAFNISRSLTTTGSQIVAGSATPTTAGEFKIIMDLLKTFGDAKTLSTPRITATDGQEAKILVGSKEAYVTSTVVSSEQTTTTADQIQFIDVGVKLFVTPTINKDGFITMKIRPEVSSATSETIDGHNIPIVSTSEAETSILVKDGVTIVMGGLMKNENTKNIYKLPLLGEIPFLGAFFRRTEDTVQKTELVIFLTPRIISGDESMIGTRN